MQARESESYTSTRPASRIFFHDEVARNVLNADSMLGNRWQASRICG